MYKDGRGGDGGGGGDARSVPFYVLISGPKPTSMTTVHSDRETKQMPAHFKKITWKKGDLK